MIVGDYHSFQKQQSHNAPSKIENILPINNNKGCQFVCFVHYIFFYYYSLTLKKAHFSETNAYYCIKYE